MSLEFVFKGDMASWPLILQIVANEMFEIVLVYGNYPVKGPLLFDVTVILKICQVISYKVIILNNQSVHTALCQTLSNTFSVSNFCFEISCNACQTDYLHCKSPFIKPVVFNLQITHSLQL